MQFFKYENLAADNLIGLQVMLNLTVMDIYFLIVLIKEHTSY